MKYKILIRKSLISGEVIRRNTPDKSPWELYNMTWEDTSKRNKKINHEIHN